MVSVMYRLLTLTHTMKSFVLVALFVVVAAVAVNATSVEKDATTLKKDVVVQQTSIKGQESGDIKNVGQGEHLPVTPAPEPSSYYIIPVTDYIKEPEKKVPVPKD